MSGNLVRRDAFGPIGLLACHSTVMFRALRSSDLMLLFAMMSFCELMYVIFPLNPFTVGVNQGGYNGRLMLWVLRSSRVSKHVWSFLAPYYRRSRLNCHLSFQSCCLSMYGVSLSHTLRKCFAPSRGEHCINLDARSMWHLIVVVDFGRWGPFDWVLGAYIYPFSLVVSSLPFSLPKCCRIRLSSKFPPSAYSLQILSFQLQLPLCPLGIHLIRHVFV